MGNGLVRRIRPPRGAAEALPAAPRGLGSRAQSSASVAAGASARWPCRQRRQERCRAAQPRAQHKGCCSLGTPHAGCTPRHRARSGPVLRAPASGQRSTHLHPQSRASQAGVTPNTTLQLRLRAGCRGDGLCVAPSKPPRLCPPALRTCKLSPPHPPATYPRSTACSTEWPRSCARWFL